jgi:hypothetical protein
VVIKVFVELEALKCFSAAFAVLQALAPFLATPRLRTRLSIPRSPANSPRRLALRSGYEGDRIHRRHLVVGSVRLGRPRVEQCAGDHR